MNSTHFKIIIGVLILIVLVIILAVVMANTSGDNGGNDFTSETSLLDECNNNTIDTIDTDDDKKNLSADFSDKKKKPITRKHYKK